MLIKLNKKLIFMSLAASLLGIIVMTTIADNNPKKSDSQNAIHKIFIDINSDESDKREEFFEQLRVFSDLHGFTIRISPTTPTGYDFLIQMWRRDFNMFGSNSFNPSEFQIGVYYTDKNVKNIPSSYIDSLVKDLETLVTIIPNISFTLKNESNQIDDKKPKPSKD